MRRIHTQLVGLLLLLSSHAAFADVLVFIHGFLGSERSWTEPGIMQIVDKGGYPYTGIYYAQGTSVAYSGKEERPTSASYTVRLPSTSPISLQAQWLEAYVNEITQQHPNEPITLIGHSAGGVVARYLVVTAKPQAVNRLLTIATPHNGTLRAAQALDVLNPSGMFSPIERFAVRRATGDNLYSTLMRSRQLINELTPPRPGNFLYWLNQQTHPAISYISIVRTGGENHMGDQIVKPVSQDLRWILADPSVNQTYQIQGGHFLTTQDGHAIVNLLQ